MEKKKLPIKVIDRKTGKYKPGASGVMEVKNFDFDTYGPYPRAAKVMAETDTSTGRTARSFLKVDKIKKARRGKQRK
jgi:hypothetical protein